MIRMTCDMLCWIGRWFWLRRWKFSSDTGDSAMMNTMMCGMNIKMTMVREGFRKKPFVLWSFTIPILQWSAGWWKKKVETNLRLNAETGHHDDDMMTMMMITIMMMTIMMMTKTNLRLNAETGTDGSVHTATAEGEISLSIRIFTVLGQLNKILILTYLCDFVQIMATEGKSYVLYHCSQCWDRLTKSSFRYYWFVI